MNPEIFMLPAAQAEKLARMLLNAAADVREVRKCCPNPSETIPVPGTNAIKIKVVP